MKTDGDSGSGLADSQVINCHSLCCRALEKVVMERLIARNPAEGCKLPTLKRKEMKILSREAMQRPLIQANEENYYERFLLEFATGLRLGELIALQWDDLDLTTGELQINKQVNIDGFGVGGQRAENESGSPHSPSATIGPERNEGIPEQDRFPVAVPIS